MLRHDSAVGVDALGALALLLRGRALLVCPGAVLLRLGLRFTGLRGQALRLPASLFGARSGLVGRLAVALGLRGAGLRLDPALLRALLRAAADSRHEGPEQQERDHDDDEDDQPGLHARGLPATVSGHAQPGSGVL